MTTTETTTQGQTTRRVFTRPRVTPRGSMVLLTGDQNSWSALTVTAS